MTAVDGTREMVTHRCGRWDSTPALLAEEEWESHAEIGHEALAVIGGRMDVAQIDEGSASSRRLRTTIMQESHQAHEVTGKFES